MKTFRTAVVGLATATVCGLLLGRCNSSTQNYSAQCEAAGGECRIAVCLPDGGGTLGSEGFCGETPAGAVCCIPLSDAALCAAYGGTCVDGATSCFADGGIPEGDCTPAAVCCMPNLCFAAGGTCYVGLSSPADCSADGGTYGQYDCGTGICCLPSTDGGNQ